MKDRKKIIHPRGRAAVARGLSHVGRRHRSQPGLFIVDPSRRALTFMEIIIVIVVMAVLLAIALPRMRGALIQARLKQGARDVAGVLRQARDFAILRELPVEIRFVPNEDWYRIVLLDENGEVSDENKPRRRNRSNRRRGGEQQPLTLSEDAAGKRMLPEGVHFAVIYSAAPLTERDDMAKDNELPRVIYYPDGSATPATIAIEDDRGAALSVEIYRTTGMARVEAGLPKKERPTQKLYYGPENKK